LILVTLAGIFLIGWMLVDSFESVVVPRRVMHRFQFARLYYRSFWLLWRTAALRIQPRKLRESMLSWFGPLSLLGLFAFWMSGLISGFAVIHWSLGTPVHAPEAQPNFISYLYLSGVTFFTLGYGDVTPVAPFGRLLAVLETGIGFGFLAAMIGYLPVLYQAFSRREATIGLLDARAGSPPTAAQFLLRLAGAGNMRAADPFLAEWERWSAEVLESHLSFPTLSFYRSQHDNQSWVAALTAILDTCSLLIVGLPEGETHQAQLTFAMARHAAVDLSLVLRAKPVRPEVDRLSSDLLLNLRGQLTAAGFQMRDGAAGESRLRELRSMYEPFVEAVGRRLLFALPPFVPAQATADNWQRSPSMPRTPGIGSLPTCGAGESHFG